MRASDSGISEEITRFHPLTAAGAGQNRVTSGSHSGRQTNLSSIEELWHEPAGLSCADDSL